MVLEDHFSCVIQGGSHCRQLHQHLGAVIAFLHHPLHLFQMPDGPGQAVDHRLLIFVNMAVGMGDPVGMEIGMVMLVVMRMVMVMVVGMVMVVVM